MIFNGVKKWYKEASKNAENDLIKIKKAMNRHQPYNKEGPRKSPSPRPKKKSVVRIVKRIEETFPAKEAVDPSHFHVPRTKVDNRSPEQVEKDAMKRRLDEMEHEVKLLRSQVSAMHQQLSANKVEMNQLRLFVIRQTKPTPPTPHGSGSDSSWNESAEMAKLRTGLDHILQHDSENTSSSQMPERNLTPPPPRAPSPPIAPPMPIETRPFRPHSLPLRKSPNKASRRATASTTSSSMRNVLSEIQTGVSLRSVPGERTPGRTAIKASSKARKENEQASISHLLSKKFKNARESTASPAFKPIFGSPLKRAPRSSDYDEPNDSDMVRMVFGLGEN